MTSTPSPGRYGSLFLLVLLVSVIVSTAQSAVGDATIYSQAVAPNRELLHRAILDNRPPSSGWGSVGATKTNVRIGVVHLAESIRLLTNASLHDIYRGIDTVFLSVFLLGLFAYLRQWVPALYALVGLMFVGAVLPLTYLMHYFQPWDRLQLCLWLLVLQTIKAHKPVLLAGALCVGMLVKFDMLLVPLLHLASHASRQSVKRVTVETALLSLLAVCLYFGLDGAFANTGDPARFNPETAFLRASSNLGTINDRGLSHPALLLHGLPLLLALVRFRTRERFLAVGVLFACSMSIIWYLFTVYAEVRTQAMLLILLLPPALMTLREELSPHEGTAGDMTATAERNP